MISLEKRADSAEFMASAGLARVETLQGERDTLLSDGGGVLPQPLSEPALEASQVTATSPSLSRSPSHNSNSSAVDASNAATRNCEEDMRGDVHVHVEEENKALRAKLKRVEEERDAIEATEPLLYRRPNPNSNPNWRPRSCIGDLTLTLTLIGGHGAALAGAPRGGPR